jgi:hypothetical protein
MQCKKVACDTIIPRLRQLRSFAGFNMGNDLALLVTYAAMLVDGNQLTDLISIGSKTPRTGHNPPEPAIVGGLDTHGVFEGLPYTSSHSSRSLYFPQGDASMTRGMTILPFGSVPILTLRPFA